jgi:hypothetical protein
MPRQSYLVKPPSPRVRPSHPLARGLLWFLGLQRDTGLRDARGVLPAGSISGGSVFAHGAYGPHLTCDGVDNVGTIPAHPATALTPPFTLAILFRTTDSGNTVVVERNGNDGFSVQMGVGASGSCGLTVGFQVTRTSRTDLADGTDHLVCFQLPSVGNATSWVDGIEGSAVSTTMSPTYGTTEPMYLGSRAGTIAPMTGAISMVAAWGRLLSAAEMRALTIDPFAAVRPARREWLYAATYTPSPTGTIAATFGNLEGSIVGTLTDSGAASGTFGALTGSASGALADNGVVSASFGALTGAGSGTLANAGTLAGSFGGIDGALTGTLTDAGVMSGTFGALAGQILGARNIPSHIYPAVRSSTKVPDPNRGRVTPL